MAGLLLDFAEEDQAGPYVFGQAGLMVHKFSSDDFGDDSETGFAFAGGAGYGFPLGGLNAWIEGRYMQGMFDDAEGESGSTGFFGLMAGISISLGDR